MPTGAPPEGSPLYKRFALESLVIQQELDRDQWSIAGNVFRAIGATVQVGLQYQFQRRDAAIPSASAMTRNIRSSSR